MKFVAAYDIKLWSSRAPSLRSSFNILYFKTLNAVSYYESIKKYRLKLLFFNQFDMVLIKRTMTFPCLDLMCT